MCVPCGNFEMWKPFPLTSSIQGNWSGIASKHHKQFSQLLIKSHNITLFNMFKDNAVYWNLSNYIGSRAVLSLWSKHFEVLTLGANYRSSHADCPGPFGVTHNLVDLLFAVFSFLEQFFSSSIVVSVAKANVLQTPTIAVFARNWSGADTYFAPFRWRIWLALCEFLCLLANESVTFVTLLCSKLQFFCTVLPKLHLS